MSQIGKKLINIPESVSVELDSSSVFTAKGPLGELSYSVMDGIIVLINDDVVEVSRKNDDKKK